MKYIIAFCGPIGCGKSTVSRLFASFIGASWNSFGATVKEIARERLIPINREELQKLGAFLVSKERIDFCRRVVKGLTREAEFGVIDGLRHVETHSELERILSPIRLLTVYIDVSPEVRFARVKARDKIAEQQLLELDKHSTEADVQRNLRELSNIVVQNDRSAEECMDRLHVWFKQYNNGERSPI